MRFFNELIILMQLGQPQKSDCFQSVAKFFIPSDRKNLFYQASRVSGACLNFECIFYAVLIFF